jgi:hypothetical protein
VPYLAAVQVLALGCREHVALAGEVDTFGKGGACRRFILLIGFVEDGDDLLELIGGDLKSGYVRPCSIFFCALIRGEDVEGER